MILICNQHRKIVTKNYNFFQILSFPSTSHSTASTYCLRSCIVLIKIIWCLKNLSQAHLEHCLQSISNGWSTYQLKWIDSMPKFLSQKAFCIKKYVKICKTEAQKSSNEPSNRSVKKKQKLLFSSMYYAWFLVSVQEHRVPSGSLYLVW